MDMNAVKQGFFAYIQEILAKENQEATAINGDSGVESNNEASMLADSEISIFMYPEEFINYVSDKFNIDSSANLSIADILDMEVVDGKLVTEEEATEASNPNPTAENTTTENQATNEQLLFQGLLNELLATEEVQNTINTDSNKDAISEDEITNFLNLISAQDGDETNLSFEDILLAVNGIKDGTFNANAEIGDTTAPADEAEEVPEVAENETPDTPAATQHSSSSSSHSSGGNNYASSSSSASSSKKEKNISNMSLDELKSELSTTKEDITEQEKTLDDALSGKSSSLTDLQSEIDENYEKYKEAIGSELAEELEDIETRLTEKEEAVSANEQAIWEQENTIADCETSYENAKSTTATIEGQLGALQGELSSLDDSEENASRKSDIQAKIGQLEQKQTAAKEAEQAALDKLNEEKEKLNGEGGLLSEKEKLQQELEAVQLEKAEFEKKLPEEDKAIQDAKTNYETAKEKFKTQQDKEVSAAREKISSSKEYINKINSEITAKENKQITKDYSVGPDSLYDEEEGQRLVDTAYKMLDKYGESHGYCATGVSRTISMAYGISMGGHGYQWDTNMDKLVEEGMFAEVTDSYPSSADLSSLPAGAVVCWENTGGTNGGGAQYGHVTIADGKGGEISDHYQANIYQSIGGGSTNYRVYIPV